MNPMDYVRILIRRGWILLLMMVLVGGSAFAFSKIQTPVYRSTQQILIEPARNDAGLTQTLIELLNSYQKWMQTYDLASKVIAQLHLDLTPDQLLTMRTITPDRNSTLITVDIDMSNGEEANQVALTYAQLFIDWRKQQNQPLQLADRINAEPLDTPRYAPIRPTTQTNVIAGALLGLLIGGVAVFVIETLNANIVRRSADVERYLKLPVLGSIPETKGV